MNRPLSTVSKVNAGMAASFLRSLSEVASLGRNKQARKATARSSPNRIQTVRFFFLLSMVSSYQNRKYRNGLKEPSTR